MFKVINGDFKNQIYGEESYLTNWPMLYILENGKQAYIGESNHVKTRMNVLMTRGIKGTYLYICDDDLRNYFSEIIEVL